MEKPKNKQYGRYKHDVRITAAIANHITPGTSPVIANTVQPTTATNYQSHINQLEDFELELSSIEGQWFGRQMDGDMFMAFINALAVLDGGQHSSAMQFLTAAKFAQRSRQWRVPRQTGYMFTSCPRVGEQCTRTCRGAMYNAGVNLRELIRGAMDRPLYEQILAYIPRLHTLRSGRYQKFEPRRYVPAVKVGYNCALRIHEMKYLRVRHWNRRTGILTIPANKADKATHSVGNTYEKLIVMPEGITILNELTRHRPPEEYLFPPLSEGGFCMEKVGQFIKEFAEQFWSPDWHGLKFDGVHVMRHGGSQAIDDYCKRHNIPDNRRTLALAMSVGNERTYLRTNEERVAKIRAAEETRWP